MAEVGAVEYVGCGGAPIEEKRYFAGLSLLTILNCKKKFPARNRGKKKINLIVSMSNKPNATPNEPMGWTSPPTSGIRRIWNRPRV